MRADDAQVAQNLMDDFRTITRVSKNGGKKWDRWRGAGTLHVRRWRPPHGIPHCTRWNMKKTIDSLDVSENIPQRPPSCWSWAALFWHTPPSQFFLRVLAIYCGHPKPAARCQPKCDAALDQHNLCQTSIMDKLSASKRTQKDFQIKKNFVLCWPTSP